MSLWIETKYASLLSGRLRNYKREGSNLWNFSCPLCGDSKKDVRKARGYLYRYKDRLNYKCHNCDASTSFRNFIKQIDQELSNEFRMELLAEGRAPSRPEDLPVAKTKPVPVRSVQNPYKGLIRLTDLPASHHARSYIDGRMLPQAAQRELYYVEKFYSWANALVPGRFKETDQAGQVLIPFVLANGETVCFQGRRLSGKSRYSYVNLKEDVPMVWGLNKLEVSPAVALEGPFDAMFFQGASVASGGGDIVLNFIRAGLTPDDIVVVYDNEPRSEHLIKKMMRAVSHGFPVCVWPTKIREKDINDMVKARVDIPTQEKIGKVSRYLFQIIMDNTFQGLKAEMAISEWRRC
jgi:hypothetical protein